MSTKRKLPAKLGQPAVTKSAKPATRVNVDESKAAVFGGGHATKKNAIAKGVVEISSESSEGEEEDEEDSEEESEGEEAEAQPTNGEDVDMEDADAPVLEEGEEAGEPSFGDLVRANAAEIDVAGAFVDPRLQTLGEASKRTQIQPPAGASLGIVLTQALRTNDIASLESCLQTTEVPTIRATIQRLESPLAGMLLSKLAERLHKRPGRAGSLMVWVQWTLVTHGGYLATQPDLMKRLAELNRVIDERSRSLSSLLSLKGKLDMLEAQIALRRNIQNERKQVDDDDEENVIYVEGQESDDDEVEGQQLLMNGDVNMSDMESEISEDMPLTNGAVAETDSEESDSEDDNLIDDEADESDDDEDDVDHDDQDSEDEDEESEEEIKSLRPSKMQRVGGTKIRK